MPKKSNFFIEENVKVNLYPLLSSVSKVNFSHLYSFIYIIKALIKNHWIIIFNKNNWKIDKEINGQRIINNNGYLILINVWKFINNPWIRDPNNKNFTIFQSSY